MEESTKKDLKVIGQRVAGGGAGAAAGVTGGRALGNRVESAIVKGVTKGLQKAVKKVTGKTLPKRAIKLKPGTRIGRLAGAVYGTVGGVAGFTKAPEVVEAMKKHVGRKSGGMGKESAFSKLAGVLTANEGETGKQYGKRMLATSAIAAAVATGAGAYALRRGIRGPKPRLFRETKATVKARAAANKPWTKKEKVEVDRWVKSVGTKAKNRSPKLRTKSDVRKLLKSKKTLVL